MHSMERRRAFSPDPEEAEVGAWTDEDRANYMSGIPFGD
jgi:hypothetical protein